MLLEPRSAAAFLGLVVDARNDDGGADLGLLEVLEDVGDDRRIGEDGVDDRDVVDVVLDLLQGS